MPPLGNLNKRVTIQYPGTSQNGIGEIVPAWTDLATVWASVEDVTGREYVAAGATQDAAITKIGIRYLSGVTAAMRVVHGADIYNIEAVLGQDHISQTLMCRRLAVDI